jgi:hypothetical protein
VGRRNEEGEGGSSGKGWGWTEVLGREEKGERWQREKVVKWGGVREGGRAALIGFPGPQLPR